MKSASDPHEKSEARAVAREIRDALRLEPFAAGGVGRLVKVIKPSTTGGIPQTVSGYVTQERFLSGKTPAQIEEALGLRVNSLVDGCIVLALQSVPGPSQIDYELTTNYPDGLAPSVISDPDFPPFRKRYVHQWRLRVPMRASFIRRLAPSEVYKPVA